MMIINSYDDIVVKLLFADNGLLSLAHLYFKFS